jgi:antitoxin (DNA-binding transcriptional repressor) of toxin-antitoxin stability system
VRAVGLKVLKNKLSEYVRLAQQGETVLITDRDRVVAELVPPGATRTEDVSDVFLAELVRKGIARPALFPPGEPPEVPPPVATLEEVLRELDDDRTDR